MRTKIVWSLGDSKKVKVLYLMIMCHYRCIIFTLLMNFGLCMTTSFCAYKKEQLYSRYEANAALLIVMGASFLLVGTMVEPNFANCKTKAVIDLAAFSRAAIDSGTIMLSTGLILWALPRCFEKNIND